MPHPKNRLKLTGDTHLPDVGFEPIAEERIEMLMLVPEQETDTRVYADGWVPPAQESAVEPEPLPQPESKAEAAVQKMGRLEAKKPWLAIGAALMLGWLAAKMLRGMRHH